jgi:hypothetical protein
MKTMQKITKNDLEKMTIIAKKIIEENPNDTWVFKGLQLMEEELLRINGEHGDDRNTIIGD